MTIILGMSIGFTAALATAAFVYAGGVLKLAQARRPIDRRNQCPHFWTHEHSAGFAHNPESQT